MQSNNSLLLDVVVGRIFAPFSLDCPLQVLVAVPNSNLSQFLEMQLDQLIFLYLDQFTLERAAHLSHAMFFWLLALVSQNIVLGTKSINLADSSFQFKLSLPTPVLISKFIDN